jgi:predicted enzyme related to lactoylglutathione lyase
MDLVLDYIEFAVDDLERAKSFYADAVGWSFNDYGPGYAGIRDPRSEGAELGGLSAEPVATRGEGILALLRTTDADAALERVLAAGATIHTEMYDFPGGRRFLFRDPFGNVLGIYGPAE